MSKSLSPTSYNMSKREAELGYPSTSNTNHGPNHQLSFSLPSLSEMDLPAPNRNYGLPSKLDHLQISKFKSSSVSPEQGDEDDDETSTPTQTRGGSTTPSPRSSNRSLSPSPSRTRSPAPSPTSTPTQTQFEKPFSTWVPDDSLRFINPNFLSSAEKQTLEQQRSLASGKRKATDVGHGDGIQETFHERSRKVEIKDERPKKIGRPLGQDDPTTPFGSQITLPQIIQPRARPATFPTHSVTPNHPSSRPPPTVIPPKPQLHRSQTDDLDLLRQVKSNNLSIPITSNSRGSAIVLPPYVPIGTSGQARHSHSYHHQQDQQVISAQPSPLNQHQQQHHYQYYNGQRQQYQPRGYELPFTHAPLYHPPSASSYTYRPNPTPKENHISPRNHSDTRRPRGAELPANHPPARPVRKVTATNLSPGPSSNAPSPSIVKPSEPPRRDDAEIASFELPHGDWRRRYVGRGRGQSGG